MSPVSLAADADQLPRAAVFAEVVRGGSFRAAASALGMAPSTVSHHVRSLEDALGVRLLERTTRSMRLTQEGERLYERMRVALQAWSDARDAFVAQREEPAGTLRVTAPAGIASRITAAAGGAFLARHPGGGLELMADDRSVDLVAKGIDVAVRMAPLPDSSLVAKQLGASPKLLVAGCALAARLPSTLAEALQRGGDVGHTAVPRDHILVTGKGGERRLPTTARAVANDAESQVALIEAGAGLSLMPRLFVREAIDAGRVMHVYPELRGSDLPIHAVYPARRLMPARVARFLPLLEQTLRDALA